MIAIAILVSGVASADNRAQEITLSFSAEQVRAAGITPGGDAIVFACLIGRYSGLPSIQQRADVVHDEDRDGNVELIVGSVPMTSVWVVVDLASGRSRVAAPEATVAGSANPREMRTGPDARWKTAQAGIDLRRDELMWLVVRPGVGAWTMRSFEGGSLDGDHARNGRLRLNLGDMRKLSGPDKPAPALVKPKDVLVVIDPYTLEYYVRGAE